MVIESALAGTDSMVALEALELELLLLRVLVAVQHFVQLLPVLISIPGGVLKGALRAKALTPGSRFPGWFLVAVAPFYTLIVAIAFIVVNQLIGKWLLVLGIGPIAMVPVLFLFHHKTTRCRSARTSRS